MTANNSNAKRRQWKRFKVHGGAIVMLRKPRLIEIGKPLLVELGPIVDISMGGLSTQYIENKQRVFDSEELAIALPDGGGVKVEPIPFKTISDVEVARMPDGKTIKNRCVKFGPLNAYQSFQLKSFMENHTIANQSDRRSGSDRRQFQDPRYEDEEYRQMYDRRMTPDRRKP